MHIIIALEIEIFDFFNIKYIGINQKVISTQVELERLQRVSHNTIKHNDK
jgi:hypothetical protein